MQKCTLKWILKKYKRLLITVFRSSVLNVFFPDATHLGASLLRCKCRTLHKICLATCACMLEYMFCFLRLSEK